MLPNLTLLHQRFDRLPHSRLYSGSQGPGMPEGKSYQGKKTLSTSTFSMSSVTTWPSSFQQQVCIISDLSFTAEIFVEALLCFHTPCQIQLWWGFGFPHPILAYLDIYISSLGKYKLGLLGICNVNSICVGVYGLNRWLKLKQSTAKT